MTAHPSPGAQDRSLGDLLREVTEGTAALVRKEVQLVRAETAESLGAMKHATVSLVIAAALGLGALGVGLAAVTLVVSHFLLNDATWLAAVIVALILGVIAAILLARATRAFGAHSLVPHETTATLKETAEWLKHPARSAERSR